MGSHCIRAKNKKTTKKKLKQKIDEQEKNPKYIQESMNASSDSSTSCLWWEGRWKNGDLKIQK